MFSKRNGNKNYWLVCIKQRSNLRGNARGGGSEIPLLKLIHWCDNNFGRRTRTFFLVGKSISIFKLLFNILGTLINNCWFSKYQRHQGLLWELCLIPFYCNNFSPYFNKYPDICSSHLYIPLSQPFK